MSRQHSPLATPSTSLAGTGAGRRARVRRLKLMAGATAAVLLFDWTAGAGAQTTSIPNLPPLPPAVPGETAQDKVAPAAPAPAPQPTDAQQQPQAQQPDPAQPPSQQAAGAPANNPMGNLPPLPLGQDSVREVQSQLVALGFDPGPVDGEAGPATLGAAHQYNESRGGSGPVPIDGALLARLQQDPGARLTPEQVAARSQPRYQAQLPAASNPIAGVVQQFQSILGTLSNGGY